MPTEISVLKPAAAQQIVADAQTARAAAQAAETGAETAQGLAETAQGLAVTAQGLAEAAGDATLIAALGAGVYDDTAAGLAATAEGDFFWIAEGDDAVLYRHDAGPVAADTELRLPLAASVEALRAAFALIGGPEGAAIQVADALGWVIARLQENGDLRIAGRLQADGGIDLSSLGDGMPAFDVIEHPEYSVMFTDPLGWSSLAQNAETGEWVGAGLGGGNAPAPVAVDFAYSEVWDNASRNLAVTYVSDSPEPRPLRYRVHGATNWDVAPPFYSRQVPLIGKWLHTSIVRRNHNTGRYYDISVDGTDFEDSVAFLPMSGVLRGAFQSDWQVSDFGPSSRTALVCAKQAAQNCHYMATNGDFLSGWGEVTFQNSQLYLAMLQRTALLLRDNGAIIPIAATHGNHELEQTGTGTGNMQGFDYMRTLFVWAYHPDSPTKCPGVDGAAYFRAEHELLLLTVDSAYGAPVEAQEDWFKSVLARHRRQGREITKRGIVVGHHPAFASVSTSWHESGSRAGALRNLLWPLMTEHLMDAYVFGHTHHIAVNDLGITMTGTGPYDFDVGSGPITFGGGPIASDFRLAPNNKDARNATDTADMFTHVLADFEGVVITKGTINNAPVTPTLWHAWTVETDADGLRAETVAAEHADTWITIDTGS